MSRNVKDLSQSVKWLGAFRHTFAVEMPVHRRVPGSDDRRAQHRPVHVRSIADDQPFRPISIRTILLGMDDMPWNTTSRGEIFVIDDDATVRETLSATLQKAGFDVICFADGAALFSLAKSRVPVCVFLEVRVPDTSGLCILRKLRAEKCPAPIFVTSANGDIPTAVDAIRNGAFDFIEKPFCTTDIMVRIDAAIGEGPRSGIRDDGLDASFHFPGCEAFTSREREVLARIAAGDTNKEVARRIGLSSRTVEGYRASIMKKAGVRNAAELIRLVFRDAGNA